MSDVFPTGQKTNAHKMKIT